MLICLLSLALAYDPFDPGPVDDNLKQTSKIVENVASAESLYCHQLEVKYRLSYAFFPEATSGKLPDNALKGSHSSIHVVFQDNLFKQIEDKQSSFLKGRPDEATYYCLSYDGNKSFNINNQLVNIINGKNDFTIDFVPHLFLLREIGVVMPFSTLLSGKDSIKAHPLAGDFRDPSLDINLVYEGAVEYAGTQCIRCTLSFWEKGKPPANKSIIWIAIDRNYIPMRAEHYVLGLSEKYPIVVEECTDWKEIKPGVWLPHTKLSKGFWMYGSWKPGDVPKQYFESKTMIDEVILDPCHPLDFFTNPKILNGSAVYELENNQIVKSYKYHAGLLQSMTDSPQSMYIMICVAVLLVVVLYFQRETIVKLVRKKMHPVSDSYRS